MRFEGLVAVSSGEWVEHYMYIPLVKIVFRHFCQQKCTVHLTQKPRCGEYIIIIPLKNSMKSMLTLEEYYSFKK